MDIGFLVIFCLLLFFQSVLEEKIACFKETIKKKKYCIIFEGSIVNSTWRRNWMLARF